MLPGLVYHLWLLVILGFYCLVGPAPVSEDVPAHAVVAEPRDEVQCGIFPSRASRYRELNR